MMTYLQRGQKSFANRTSRGARWAGAWCFLISMLASLHAAAQPANDIFTNATVIALTNRVIIGGNVGATKEEPDEPFHWPDPVTAALSTNSVWYKWTPTNNTQVTFRNTGSFAGMVFAIYTGASVDALTFVANNVRTNVNQITGVTNYTTVNQATFNATAGTDYMIAVDGRDGNIGRVVLSWVYGNGSAPSVGVAGAFGFSFFETFVTENETTQAPYQLPDITPTLNGRSVRGAVFTVTRTGGSTGRVSVRYRTVNTSRNPCGTVDSFDALAGCDYDARSGILFFDDFQMSQTIVIPVHSDGELSWDKTVAVLLEDPQSHPNEAAFNPGLVVPVLSGTPFALATIREINLGRKLSFGTGTNFVFSRTNIVIERATYAADEEAGTVRIDLLNVGGTTANVFVHWTGVNDKGAYTPLTGSDYADPTGNTYSFPQLNGGVFPIPNPPDFIPTNRMQVSFGQGQGRRSVRIPINSDGITEFNEDVLIFLERFANNEPPIGANGSARVTILYDEPPAGALDREWNPDGVSYTTPRRNPVPGANFIVRAVAVQPDQKTVIGGDFSAYNSFPRFGLARINQDGSNDDTFDPGSGVAVDQGEYVAAVAVYSAGSTNDGKIVVGGNLTAVNGLQRIGVARLNVDGSVDASFDPGVGPNGTVRSLAIQNDGKVVIVGEFTAVGGVTRNGVARLNSDGSLDLGFNPGAGPDGPIWSVAVLDTGIRKIFIGGEFLNFNGIYRGNVARLNDNGSLDSAYDTGGGTDGPVYAVAPQADGRLLVGGFFSTADFADRHNIARLLTSGAVDPSYDPGTGANDAVYAIKPQLDGKAFIGGVFTSFNETRRVGLARLFANGTVDTSFLDTAYNQFAGLINDYYFEPPNYVNAIDVQADGNVMIGGSFSQVGGNFAEELNSGQGLRGGVWSRSDKRVRYNVARLVGGYTPGPGNIGLVLNQNTIDEFAGTLSVPVDRYDGRLGRVSAGISTSDNLATNGVDFSSGVGQPVWNQDASDGAQSGIGSIDERLYAVSINDDTLIEGDESFGLALSNPNGSLNLSGDLIPLGAALAQRAAVGTITDDDKKYGTFVFNAPVYFTNENAGYLRFTVLRTNGSAGPVGVDYFTRNGTALAGQDYTGVTLARLTFGQGVTSLTFSNRILDDAVVEQDETYTITLTNATGGATIFGGFPTSTVTATAMIIDNDFSPGRANFSSTNYSAVEGTGTAQITLLRLGGNVGELSVSLVTTNSGTAQAGVDYSPVTNVVTWVHEDVTPKTVTIPLLDDLLVENSESLGLRLINPSVPNGVGGFNTATLTIVDDDPPGALAFSQAVYDVDERGPNISITVVRTGGAGGTNQADFSIVNGTAVNGTHFSGANGTLVFGPGVTATNLTISIIDNVLTNAATNALTAQLLLTNPSHPLGSISNATLRIIDDESVGDPAGSLDPAFNAQAGSTNAIYGLALQRDGRLIVAGDFRTLNRVSRNRVGRLNEDGTLDSRFSPRSGPNAGVRAVALQEVAGSERVIIGGLFQSVAGTNRNRIARLLADGSVDAQFNPGSGADNPVFAVAVRPDGRVVVGGSFSTMNGVSRPGLALLEADGRISPTFDTGLGINGTVFALAAQNDGKILVGGDFTLVNGVSRPNLARLNADGSVDGTFDPGTGPDAAVRAIMMQADGRLLVGGSFSNINGTVRGRLARLNSDGSLDAGFLAGLDGGNGDVTALTLQFDGRIIVVGDFTRFNGVTRNRITRLNRNGKTDPSINFGNGANDSINAVAVQLDRKIVIGGRFSAYDDQPRQALARIHGGSIAGTGTLQYSSPFYEVAENAGPAVITVRRRGGTETDITVDYLTVAGTATAGVDYTNVSGTFTFLEGETHRTFAIPLVNDTAGELAETVSLLLTNQTPGVNLGEVPSAVLLIMNDDSGIGFSAPSYTVNESAIGGGIVISVIRAGSTNGGATVNYTTTNGTAIAGQDYTARSGQLVFAPGETVRTFTVPITDDDLIESSEAFGVVLSGPTGSAALSQATATVTIVDNDFRAGSLTFAALSYSVAESGGSVTISVVRTNGSTGVLSVEYTTVPITASNGLDFVAQSGLLVFNSGITNQTIIIPILDDSLVEGDETFSVQLVNPDIGTVISGPTSVTVSILDEERGPGSLDPSFDPGVGANGVVRKVALQTNGMVLVSGAFTQFNGVPRNYVARLNTNGPLDLSFAPGAGPNAFVASVAAAPGNRVLIAGSFTQVNGGAYNRAALLLSSGLPDVNYHSPVEIDSAVYTMLVQPDGRALLGGAFNQPTRGITRLGLDGAVDSSFSPGGAANDAVHAIAVQSDGSVVIGGNFSAVDGEPHRRIARLTSQGLVDSAFASGAIATGTVFSLAVQLDGKVLVGGDFVTSAGTNRVNLARLNSDGTLDTGFAVGLGANSIVYAVGLQSDGRIMVAGDFTLLNGAVRNRFARLNTDGSLDTSFDPGRGANNTVYSLLVQPDDNVLIGGDFTLVGGVSRRGVARILAAPVAPSAFSGVSAAGGQFQLSLSVTPGIRYVLEASTNLRNWSPVATNLAASATWHFTQPNLQSYPTRFFRVREARP